MDPKHYLSILLQNLAAQANAARLADPTQTFKQDWLGLPKQVIMNQETPVWSYADERAVWLALFCAEEEDEGMTSHFRRCGWKNNEIAKLRNFAWFSAKVEVYCIPLAGVELNVVKGDPELVQHVGTAYLGSCCYKTIKEFVDVKHRTDYLLDLMSDAVDENLPKLDAVILAPVRAWFQDQRELRYAAQQAHFAALAAKKGGV